MHPLLICIIAACSFWPCLTQVADQDAQTTTSAGHTPQDSGTLSTLNASYYTSVSSTSGEAMTSKEHPQSSVPDDMLNTVTSPASLSDALNGTEVNQSSVTNDTTAEDLGEQTMTRTSMPSKEVDWGQNEEVHAVSEGDLRTPQTPTVQQMSQSVDTASTAAQTSLEVDTSSSPPDTTTDDVIQLTTAQTYLEVDTISSPPDTTTDDVIQLTTAQTLLEVDPISSHPDTTTDDDVLQLTTAQTSLEVGTISSPPDTTTDDVRELTTAETSLEAATISSPPDTTTDDIIQLPTAQTSLKVGTISSPPDTTTDDVIQLTTAQTSLEVDTISSHPDTSTEDDVLQLTTDTVSTAALSSLQVDTISSPPDTTTKVDVLQLTTEDVLLCFQKNILWHISIGAGEQVGLRFSQEGQSIGTPTCKIQFTVPQGMYVQMLFWSEINFCGVYEALLETYYFNERLYCKTVPTRVVAPSNWALFTLSRRFQWGASVRLSVNFTAVPPPALQIKYINDAAGYVQTPDWDGWTNYPKNLDLWEQLNVTTQSSVMVSFHAMDINGGPDCQDDYLEMWVVSDGAVNVNRVLCNGKPLFKPTVFPAVDKILFYFKSYGRNENLGFRLYFSLHDQNEMPEKLETGRWNCSLPYWPKFQLHLNCNLVEECSSGEDEEHCDYTSASCGKGFFSVSSRCYRLFDSGEKQVTWNEADNECRRHKGQLASLNSPDDWEQVIQVIRRWHRTESVYVGMRFGGSSLPEIYRNQFNWLDVSPVLYASVSASYSPLDCTAVPQGIRYETHGLTALDCDQNKTGSFLCEVDQNRNSDAQPKLREIVLHRLEWVSEKYVVCPAGHVTHNFLACDLQSRCWASETVSTFDCGQAGSPPSPSLQCVNGMGHVPYTLVCDHRPDCSDNSDENFCVFRSCSKARRFQCTNKQCVAQEKKCNKIPDCVDGSDEQQCYLEQRFGIRRKKTPAILEFDGLGYYETHSIMARTSQSNGLLTDICPETHFLCPGNLTYCMPVFVRCNGVNDCPGREDEGGCDRYQCPGFYRCRASPICVHAKHLCDGVFQCPQHDDELLCDAICPQNCTCYGLAFYCHGHFLPEQHPEIRFLHAHGSGLSPKMLTHNSMLIYLNLANCDLKDFDLGQFPNLRILDLSDNHLASFNTTQIQIMNNLRTLFLAGNPLTVLSDIEPDSFTQFPLLETLNLSNVIVPELNVTKLLIFPKLAFLNLTGSGIERITGEGFRSLQFLMVLDVRYCPMTEFPRNIFEGLKYLKEVWADNYKLCCPATLPKSFHQTNCHAPSDEISSCDALLRSDFYRGVLSVFAVLAMLGNLGSFVYRMFIKEDSKNLGFDVFVTHLCVSDFLMGVYLAVIGIADRIYHGNYLWKDNEWKQSTGCKMAGFLSLLSSEVSAFMICLITLDRFLVLRFPFSNVHFRKTSAHVACMIAWLVGIVLAGVPLLPFTAHWNFYSQNGICIPLPITRNEFAGHDYSFGVMIIVNFIIFLFIAAGQVIIYWSIRTNRMSVGDSNKKSNDLIIARRLVTVVTSDFLCWFPVGLLGLLSSIGVPIPGEVNVAIAIIILPVNSAINPFLYTVNILMERRMRAREIKTRTLIMSMLSKQYSKTAIDRSDDGYTESKALQLIRNWLSHDRFSLQNLEKIVKEAQEKLETCQKESG